MVGEIGAVGRETIIGVAQEDTWGTPETPNRFFEMTEEGWEIELREMQSNSWRPSAGNTRQARPGSRVSGRGHTVSGSLGLEVPTVGFGFWLRNILGRLASSTQIGTTGVYTHVFKPAPLVGSGFTFQKVLRKADGSTVSTHTYPGGKVTQAEFSASPGEILTCSIEAVAKEERTDFPAADTPTYIDDLAYYSWDDGQIMLDGQPLATVSEASLQLSNGLNTERDHLGNGGIISEPIDNGDGLAIEGSLTAEYYDLASLYLAAKNRERLSYRLRFVNPDAISGSTHESITFDIPYIRLGVDTPKADDADLITVDVPWNAWWDNVNDSITVTYVSLDTPEMLAMGFGEGGFGEDGFGA